MKMNKQQSVRSNTVPNGGVANPTAQSNAVTRMKMPMVDEMDYVENFRAITEFNTISQRPENLFVGQEASIKVNNIGFLETMNLEVNAVITLKNNNAAARTVQVAEDFPLNLISRVTSQFNGSTVTHSTNPYSLFELMLKRSIGNKAIFATQTAGRTANTLALTATEANTKICKKYPTEYISVTLADDSGTTMYVIEADDTHQQTLTGLRSIAIATGKTITITVKFFIPIPYTLRKDLPIGLIPLQNNSVYLEVKTMMSNVISLTYATPFVSANGAELSDITMTATTTATPHNDFYSVPSPEQGGLASYEYFLMYNYIVNDQTITVNSTGADALAYPIPNNTYLASLSLTCRNSTTKRLLDINTLLDYVYIDYNGTATVRKNPLSFDLYKLALEYGSGSPLNFGQFIKDFWNSTQTPNGADWSRMLNMYEANSPLLKAQVNTAGTDITVTRENIVPTNAIVI